MPSYKIVKMSVALAAVLNVLLLPANFIVLVNILEDSPLIQTASPVSSKVGLLFM